MKSTMIHFSRTDIDKMDKIFRLNLINSCTGFKSANLLGTKSLNGVSNVAVFSSITHLGSNPPLIGFILRPTTVPRDTYRNIKDTGVFTVNHINSDITEDAHHTSAKYPDEVSEFTKTDLQEEFLGDFSAPFVKDAKIRLGCTFLNEYEIKENDTLLLVSQVDHLCSVWLIVCNQMSCKFVWRYLGCPLLCFGYLVGGLSILGG